MVKNKIQLRQKYTLIKMKSRREAHTFCVSKKSVLLKKVNWLDFLPEGRSPTSPCKNFSRYCIAAPNRQSANVKFRQALIWQTPLPVQVIREKGRKGNLSSRRKIANLKINANGKVSRNYSNFRWRHPFSERRGKMRTSAIENPFRGAWSGCLLNGHR